MEIEFSQTFDLGVDVIPIAAKKMLPKWVKVLPTSAIGVWGETLGTVKKCPPIIDFLSSGYYILSPGTFNFSRKVVNGEEDITISGRLDVEVNHDDEVMNIPLLGMHTFDQAPIIINNIKKSVWRFNQWWTIKTPQDYSCLILPATYFFQPFTVLPTILDTDSGFKVPQGFAAVSNFNDESEHTWVVNKGDPIAMVVPFKRDEWGNVIKKFNPTDQKYALDKNLQSYTASHRVKKSFK